VARRKIPVFINCPFDGDYLPFFHATIFTVYRCGFTPRCALEVIDGGGTRIAKIEKLIEECPFGIHDISRTELDATNRLPRFNMPLELGLFLGARRYGAPPFKHLLRFFNMAFWRMSPGLQEGKCVYPHWLKEF
jgi:hypothetical protein